MRKFIAAITIAVMSIAPIVSSLGVSPTSSNHGTVADGGTQPFHTSSISLVADGGTQPFHN